MRSTRSRWSINLLVVALSVAVALFIVEGAARLFVGYVKPNIMVLDDNIGWKQRSNAHRSYPIEGHVAHVTTLAQGLRGKMYVGATDRRRVLILGDSFTAGLEVSDAELFSEILDERRPDLEIVNAGVGAYGTVQELLMLERLEPTVEPDCILLMAYVNDLTDNIMPFSGGMGPRPYADADGQLQPMTWEPFDPLLLPVPGARWLHRHSVFAYLVRNRLWLPYRDAQLAGYIPGWRDSVSSDVKWSVFEKMLKRLGDKRQVVIVALPPKEDVISGDYEFTNSLATVSKRLNFGFINLADVLRPEHFYEIDIHWNPDGHRAVAEYLSSQIDASESENNRCFGVYAEASR